IELDLPPFDRVAQVVLGAHIHTALRADGLADIGVASLALDHHRLEAGVAAMDQRTIQAQAVATTDLGAGPVAGQAATLEAIAEEDVGGAAACATEGCRVRAAAGVVSNADAGAACAGSGGGEGDADGAGGAGR